MTGVLGSGTTYFDLLQHARHIIEQQLVVSFEPCATQLHQHDSVPYNACVIMAPFVG